MDPKITTLHVPALKDGLSSIMKEGVLFIDESDKIERANQGALKLFQTDRRDILEGKDFIGFFLNPNEGQKFLQDLADKGRLEDQAITLKGFDGESISVSCSALFIQTQEDQSSQRIVLLHHVMDSSGAEKKVADYTARLEKKNKELDQFAYIVSHDLKAPLRAISNLSLWLQEDLGPSLDEENKTNLTMLRSRVLRLESLINGILEYSKIGRIDIVSERVDVYPLVQEVVEMLSPRAGLNISICDNMPVVDAPKIMLFQVFSNLIGNAIKYNDKSDCIIRVGCTDAGEMYEFVVEDNGPGISPEFFETIFVIFQTLQSRDKVESTGIGLTIVKRIIDDFGGKIWVESEVGKGSKFKFTWPKEPII